MFFFLFCFVLFCFFDVFFRRWAMAGLFCNWTEWSTIQGVIGRGKREEEGE